MQQVDTVREPTIPHVTREQIARRAHEMWVAAGRPPGLDLNFWLSAELLLTHPPAERSPRGLHGAPVTGMPSERLTAAPRHRSHADIAAGP